MKLLAFAASNSRHSINKHLVTHAASVYQQEFAPKATIEILDLNDFEMPIYSIDRENEDGIPQLAHDFYAHIGDANALLISYAEHNGHHTAAFKNLFDWSSRINKKVFQNKPMVIMSAAPGPRGGASSLKAARESAPFFGAEIIADFTVGQFSDVFDTESVKLTDPALVKTLNSSLAALHHALL